MRTLRSFDLSESIMQRRFILMDGCSYSLKTAYTKILWRLDKENLLKSKKLNRSTSVRMLKLLAHKHCDSLSTVSQLQSEKLSGQ